MKASPLVALTSAIILIGCAGYGRPETPLAVECLDGNYIRLSSCTLEQLAQRQGRLNLRDTREQHIVRIAHTNGIETRWELSFVNEDGGRQTRLEVTSADGSLPTEHVLASARACAAEVAMSLSSPRPPPHR